jgi:hypothetical protein
MRASRIWKAAFILGALLIISTALLRGLRSSEPPVAEVPSSTPVSPPAAPPTVPPTAPLPNAEALTAVPCELATLVAELRKSSPSPAYRRYLGEQLRSLRGALPPETLWSQLVAERDPPVLELLAELWVSQYARNPDARVLERLVDHLSSEREPSLRAALIRALRHSGEPSTELLGRSVLKGRDVYAAWVKDEAREVRQAVVENVRVEAARNFGRFQGVAEKAVALAEEATEPTVKAALLTASSIEAARAPAVARVQELLQKSERPELRAAAAKALGTVSAAHAAASMKALTEHYAAESDRLVRGAILESISRLGLGKAVPVLQQLRGVDASMQGEVDHWLTLLASQPQTWELLDKDHRATGAQARQ